MGTCLRLELEAAALYRRFQGAASSPELAKMWETMSREEMHHAHLVDQLAMKRGFVVPAVARDLLAALVQRVEAVRHEADLGALDDERMLSITAALEFSEMDDLFGAICRGGGVDPDSGRGDHLAPLVEAVMTRACEGSVLRHLLAAMIRLHRRAPRAGLDDAA
jgi:hypothetical protein